MMDLGAYAKIDDLSQIMEDNGISVPRLRGLRLMSEEKPLTKEELEEQINDQWLWQCEKLCCSQFQLNANWMDLNYKTSQIEQYYLIKKNGDTNGVRWNVLHGKKTQAVQICAETGRKTGAEAVRNLQQILRSGRNPVHPCQNRRRQLELLRRPGISKTTVVHRKG